MKIISRSKVTEKISTRVSTIDNLLLFTLLGDQYALMSDSVLQILQTLIITPVANSIRYFVGSTTFRGEVVPVIDLQSFFYGGQLAVTSRTPDERKSYIALDHADKIIIFQVETILGSVEMPEESEVTGLVNFANPEENPYYDKAFIYDEQIIVLLEHGQILERVIYELEQSQIRFIEENKALLVPIELPEASEEYNIDLQQKLSAQAPTTSAVGIRKAISVTKKVTRTATLVSVQDLDILVPNNSIIEIYNVPNITKIPNAPKAVVGAINFRGNVISALNLAEILVPTSTDIKKKEMNRETAVDVLVLESADQQFAVFVDEIREIVEMTEDDLRQTLASSNEAKSDYYFQGVMLDQSGHIILVLNVDYLLQVISNPVVLEQDSTQVILFDVPTHEVASKTEVARQVALGENALVLITLLGDKYALMSASVVEILQTLIITPVANSVRYFVGSTTFRGEVVPVIDLQSFFYGGQLAVTSRALDERKSYIALDQSGKTIIFQVETILGSVEMPEESEVTGLVNFTNPEENPYNDKAFIYDEQIIVLLEHGQILERVIYELEQSQIRFIEENKALLVPIELPEASEEYNIDLQQKLSAQAPTTSAVGIEKAISVTKKVTRTATLVSVQDLDILVPNDHIVEIFSVLDITKIPNAPKAVVGAINFRGNVISALNLAEILVPTSTEDKKDRTSLTTAVDVLILESADQQFAVFVDEIREIVEMTEDDLRQTLASSNEAKSDYYFQGVMLDQSGHIILVLNVDYLLQVISNPFIIDQESTQTILFDVPTHEVASKTEVARQAVLGENALVLITLLGDKYALMSASVVQILQTLTITPVANSVRYFVGSTTFRGEVVPVIDLQSFFYGGQLNIATRTPDEQKNYIALDHTGKTVIFQVETVLGSVEMPEESEVTGLVNFANPEENPYYDKAFLYDEQIIVLLEHGQILERVIYELEQSQTRFIEENQALLIPIELPEASEEYNIDLQQKLSAQAPITSDMGIRKTISSAQKVTRTATLVSVQNLDILVPNNNITQIFNVPNITKVPNAPRAVVGAINFHGNVLSALDLAEILVPTSTDDKKDQTSLTTNIDILVLESADQQFAVFVDEIREIVEMTEDDLRLIFTPTSEADFAYYFQGVMLDQSGHIILVLNVDYLLQVISNPEVLDQDSTQTILFDVPTHEVASKTEVARQAALDENALVLITLLGDKYALMSASVVEILQTLIITPVANSVRYFAGSTTFRGEIVPIIDLQSFFYGGQLNIATRTPDEQKNYIALDHTGKTIIFQVETVLGSIEMPEESDITGLVNFANPEENPYYEKAFLYDEEQIIVLLEHGQILERVIYELEQSQTRFIEDNQALLIPIELPEASEEYNIDLQQKLSAQAPTTSAVDVNKTISSAQKVTRTATLVSVQDLDILVPNDHIVEIFSVPNITKIPNAPKAVVGAIDFRGNVISALNLAEILVPTSTDDKKDRTYLTTAVDVLILESADQQFAVFVDEIREIVEMSEDDFRQTLASSNETKSDYYFQGVMLDQSGHIILVLNVDHLLQIIINPEVFEQEINQAILFDAPTQEMVSKTEVARQVALSEDNLFLFTLLGDKYALMSSAVVQILQTPTITPIANSVRYFVGSTTFHGEIIPVIDLQSFFYREQLAIRQSIQHKQRSYIALEYAGNSVIFQVETVLGSIEMPEESDITGLVNFANPEENPYFSKAFPGDEQIIVLLEHGQILERVIYELEHSQTQFIQDNQAFLVPIELPENSEEYNIDLQQKLSVQAPTTGVITEKAVRTTQETKHAGTLVSVQELDILVPNDHIVEIFSVPNITKVPNAPKAIVGSISFRGDVLSILNLAEILVPSSTNGKNDQSSLTTDVDVLILESADQRIAIFVDEIREIMEIDEADLRPILASTSETNRDHYFQGLLLDHMEQIILVLNVDYLFQVVTDPDVLEEDSTQITYFENPVEESTYQVTESLQEGLLFEDEGHLFYLDSEYVVQVIEQNAFQFKKYSHDAIIGAAIHANIVPLIDFSIILKGKRVKPSKSKKSVGILVSDPKSNLEVVLLVDSVMNRVPIDKFETFQTNLGISTKVLSPIVSGFFSYRDALGMIMSPVCLFQEIFSVLKDTLPLKDIKEEFSLTLLPEELEFLEAIRVRRKELELLLFYHHEGIRLDFFVFKWREKLFSIDIDFVRRVFASLKLQNIDLKYHPIIGIATEDNVKLPIIDLAALILDTEKQTEFTKSSYFFSIEQQNQTFLVPVDGIEGVVTKFKEELVPCEDASIFLEGKETCQHTFSYENISSPIYIIENEYITKMLTKKDLETQLKKLRKKKSLKKKD